MRFSFALCFAAFMTVPSFAGNLFTPEDLKANRFDLAHRYPPTVCALKKLLGVHYDEMMDKARDGGFTTNQAAWENAESEEGSVFLVHRNGQNAGSYIVWFHPTGAIVAGYRADSKLLAFTNEGKRVSTLPAAFQAWLDEAKKDGMTPQWTRPQTDTLDFPESCRPEKLAGEIEKYVEKQQGRACDYRNIDNLTFSQRPYLVLPLDGGSRAPLLRSPGGKPNSKEPYLIAGDLVQVAEANGAPKAFKDHICVFYQGDGAKITLGWVASKTLKGLPDTINAEAELWFRARPALPWPAKAQYRANYPGKLPEGVRAEPDTIRITQPQGSSDVTVKLKAAAWILDATQFTAKSLSPRVARYVHLNDGKPAGNVNVILFNNAIYVSAQNESTKATYRAIFYP